MDQAPDQAGAISPPTQPLHVQLLSSRGIANPTRAEFSAAAREVAGLLEYVRRRREFAGYRIVFDQIKELQHVAGVYGHPAGCALWSRAEPANEAGGRPQIHKRASDRVNSAMWRKEKAGSVIDPAKVDANEHQQNRKV
jgi:hypothetical protein